MPGILNWDLGDSSNNVYSNDFSHTYSSAGNKTVTVNKGTTDGSLDIIRIWMSQDNIVGTFDVSSLLSLIDLKLDGNPELTNVIFPDSSALWEWLYLQDTSIGPTLDLRNLKGLGGTVYLQGNRKLKYILCPSTNRNLASFAPFSCDLTGTLDISCMKGQLSLDVNNNPNLNYIINPSVGQSTYVNYYAYGFSSVPNGLMGTLDLRDTVGLRSTFRVEYNPSLNTILNPSTGNDFTTYWAFGCGLTGTHDMRPLNRLGSSGGTNLQLQYNPSLNSVLFPKVTATLRYVQNLYINNCNLLGTLDISGLVLGGTTSGFVELENNPNLNYIINPSTGRLINRYYAYNCGLMGTLDLSVLRRLGGDINLVSNPSLNMVINPNSSVNITQYRVSNCDITGTLDMRPLKSMGGYFHGSENPNLTQIINSESSLYYNEYYFQNCNLTGTLDCSKLTGGIGYMIYDGNPNLNFVLHPSTNVQCTLYQAQDCSLKGTIDLSNFRGLRNYIYFQNNNNLQNIILPTFLYPPLGINATDCSLSTSCLDDMINKVYTFYSANPPTYYFTFNALGGGNAWPTNGNNNTNLLLCASIFIDNGFTATFNVNDPPPETLFTYNSSSNSSGSTQPAGSGIYYNNHLIQVKQATGGGSEYFTTISVDEAGNFTNEASISYSYPNSITLLNGMLFSSKLFQTISSFYVDPGNGAISKWKDNNSPIVPRFSMELGTCQDKLIAASRGNSDIELEVYSYTTDASGTLTKDSSLNFSSKINDRMIVSGDNFCYLLRITDGSVATTNILTISGGVLTDTGYDISLGGPWNDMRFSAVEDNSILYTSYTGRTITRYSINQTTGEPTYIDQIDSSFIGIYSGVVGPKLINVSNDYLDPTLRFLKSYDLATFTYDGSKNHNCNSFIFSTGIVEIDSSMFVTITNAPAGGAYHYDSFTIDY